MGGIKHFNESKFLKEILTFSIDNKVCEVEYEKNSNTQSYFVQFFNISSTFGQWYASAYNQLEKPIVFRCDRILGIKESTQYVSKDLLELEKSSYEIFKNADAIDFKVEITQKDVDKFHKENYPSMKLEVIEGRLYISGYYNPGEEHFIASYFISYGKQILSIYPDVLKKSIKENLNELDSYYRQMNQVSFKF